RVVLARRVAVVALASVVNAVVHHSSSLLATQRPALHGSPGESFLVGAHLGVSSDSTHGPARATRALARLSIEAAAAATFVGSFAPGEGAPAWRWTVRCRIRSSSL